MVRRAKRYGEQWEHTCSLGEATKHTYGACLGIYGCSENRSGESPCVTGSLMLACFRDGHSNISVQASCVGMHTLHCRWPRRAPRGAATRALRELLACSTWLKPPLPLPLPFHPGRFGTWVTCPIGRYRYFMYLCLHGYAGTATRAAAVTRPAVVVHTEASHIVTLLPPSPGAPHRKPRQENSHLLLLLAFNSFPWKSH